MRIVLLHALPLDERMWAPQREVLAAYDVAAPRLYGRGDSVDAWAESVLREVDGPLVLVGASMGGYCALAMARREAERVHGLLLAGSRAGADTDERRRARDELVERLRREGPTEWREQWGDALGSEDVDELVQAVRVLRDRPDATDVVEAFDLPLAVVVGDSDELVGVEEARELAARAPQGRLDVVAGAGHFVTLEQPEEFNGILLDFLAQWT